MSRTILLATVLIGGMGLAGCRCVPGFTLYGDVIDGVTDYDIFFQRAYTPRLDISRAGKPDWCGPINRRLAPCRCLYGTWDRYDDCWLYPPGYPYQYPDQAAFQASPSEAEVPPQPLPAVNPLDLELSTPARQRPDGQLAPPPKPAPPTASPTESPAMGWRTRGPLELR